MAGTTLISKRGYRDVLFREPASARHTLGQAQEATNRVLARMCWWLDPQMQARQQCRIILCETFLGRSLIKSRPPGPPTIGPNSSHPAAIKAEVGAGQSVIHHHLQDKEHVLLRFIIFCLASLFISMRTPPPPREPDIFLAKRVF